MLNVDPSSMYNIRKKKATRHERTCEWILEKAEFDEWRTLSGPQILIIVAPPGQGKSTLAKYLLQEIREDLDSSTSSVVLEFFCHDSHGYNSASSVLQSILFQLLAERRKLFKHVFQR